MIGWRLPLFAQFVPASTSHLVRAGVDVSSDTIVSPLRVENALSDSVRLDTQAVRKSLEVFIKCKAQPTGT